MPSAILLGGGNPIWQVSYASGHPENRKQSSGPLQQKLDGRGYRSLRNASVHRICVFHMSAKIASKKPALTHEAMGVMLADCFRNQVDYITGDANMAGYRTGGSKQGSTSIRDSCFQETVGNYLKAYNAAQNGDPYCCPKAKFATSNPLTLLRWMEDRFGVPWKNVGAVDWQSVPGLWSRVSLSGRIASQWRDGHRPRTQPMSTRSVSPSGCFIATGMSTCFRSLTTTLILLFSFI